MIRTDRVPLSEIAPMDAENLHSHRANLQTQFADVEANESARKPWLSDEEAPGEDGTAEKKMERLPLAKPLLVLRNDCSEIFGQRQA
jgi:hypothetical protein